MVFLICENLNTHKIYTYIFRLKAYATFFTNMCYYFPSPCISLWPTSLPTSGKHQSAVCAQTGVVRGQSLSLILLYLSVPTQSLLATLVTYSWLKGGTRGRVDGVVKSHSSPHTTEERRKPWALWTASSSLHRCRSHRVTELARVSRENLSHEVLQTFGHLFNKYLLSHDF